MWYSKAWKRDLMWRSGAGGIPLQGDVFLPLLTRITFFASYVLAIVRTRNSDSKKDLQRRGQR
jgi:hypothetical protein